MDDDVDDPDSNMSMIQGNDLLLTTCRGGSACIFGQANWKRLTEWTSGVAAYTHVDWIQGMAAMTLRDLVGRKSSSSSTRSSKMTSQFQQ